MIFKEAYEEYFSELFKFGYQIGLSEEESKDIVQDAFLKLEKALRNNHTEIENPKAWLYKVVYRDSRTFKKRVENHRRINKEFSQQIYYNSKEDQEQEYDEEEKRQILLSEISKLPEKEGLILLLQFDNLSYKEISEVLEININSIGSYISRARKALLNNIKTKYNELF